MTDSVPSLHPRKLYAMLRACDSTDTRAQAALSFVRACTGAAGGFLLLARGGELVIAARAHEGELPPGLVSDAMHVWNQAIPMQTDLSATLDAKGLADLDRMKENPRWQSSNGEVFERRMLAIHRGPQWVRAGMLVLKLGTKGALLPIRHAHIEALCNAFIDAEDVAGD